MIVVMLLFLFIFGPNARADTSRQDAMLFSEYHGVHPEEFAAQFDRVRLLIRQAQLEISSRLGLFQYQQGFRCPLTIRFEDGAPVGMENPLAYVQLYQSSSGFRQELIINLDAYAQYKMDFDKLFYHEMTHAVLNDAVGGEASLKIPSWVQEGFAQYISNEGEDRLRGAIRQTVSLPPDTLLCDLSGPPRARCYPQYYLTIKYILDKGGTNALQAFARDLAIDKTVSDSLQDTVFMDLPTFEKNVHDYSLDLVKKAPERDPYHVFPR